MEEEGGSASSFNSFGPVRSDPAWADKRLREPSRSGLFYLPIKLLQDNTLIWHGRRGSKTSPKSDNLCSWLHAKEKPGNRHITEESSRLRGPVCSICWELRDSVWNSGKAWEMQIMRTHCRERDATFGNGGSTGGTQEALWILKMFLGCAQWRRTPLIPALKTQSRCVPVWQLPALSGPHGPVNELPWGSTLQKGRRKQNPPRPCGRHPIATHSELAQQP
ncbi:uncharacterized protein LOC142836495 [Microtus pennsylvanicus]|uniref:uncharacterized protein LOC142836495 n=1 Tax=Microtus pennsylvanicus TaxID=10058 RepID=UPI003F6B649D